jgi:hypothetical protein
MKEPEKGKTKTRGVGAIAVAGWCAILAVPFFLMRILLLATEGQLEALAAAARTGPSGWLTASGLDTLVFLIVAPIALLSLIAGIGILRRKRPAWVTLMLFLVVALVLNLVRTYFARPEYGLMLIYSTLALLLNQPDVRQAFRIGRPSREPVE